MPNPVPAETPSKHRQKQILINIFWLLVVLRLGASAAFPVVQDEAYYFYWARFLDWGYFDHPPMVAWWASLSQVFPTSWFWGRFGTMIAALLLYPVSLSICKEAGIRDFRARLAAVILFHLNLGGLLFGFIATPDAPLIFFWTLAMHEAIVALNRDPRRWLSAGLITGLGLWGKYTMTLIGPVFLWALLRDSKRGLKSPWPYLGGVLAVLVFLPHLMWSANHDWISLKFQFGHGLKGSHEVTMDKGTDLPDPLVLTKNDPEYKLGEYFKTAEERARKPKPEKTPFQKFQGRIKDFVTSQIGLWGALAIPIALAARRRRSAETKDDRALNESARNVLAAGIVVPLALFGLAALNKPIEANWPAIYLLAASFYFSAILPLKSRALLIAAACNIALVGALIWHSHMPLRNKAQDRILSETRGYRDLADLLQNISEPLFADTYQNTAMLSFYLPDQTIAQWPGITRHSEMIRRPEMNPYHYKDLKDEGFTLVSEQEYPPRLPGFAPEVVREVRDCLREGTQVSMAFTEPEFTAPCEDYTHRWFIIAYGPASEQNNQPTDIPKESKNNVIDN